MRLLMREERKGEQNIVQEVRKEKSKRKTVRIRKKGCRYRLNR